MAGRLDTPAAVTVASKPHGKRSPPFPDTTRMSEFAVEPLLKTPTVTVRDVYCRGSHREQTAEECTNATQLVFPYRGVYVRHLGRDQAVAEANQVLFFNAGEGYRVSHPVLGGDASLTVILSEAQMRELAPSRFLRDGPT